MINAKELRIGNFVINANKKNVKTENVKFTGYSKLTDWYRINEIGDSFYDPILLTEEILHKCSFGKVGFYDNVYHLNNFRIYLDKSKNTFLLKYEEGNNNLEIEVISLHQLQNLYFILTNKELEVEL